MFNVRDKSYESKVIATSFGIPLYSRSIAIDNGDIYLTGGLLKPQNVYLNMTFLYDEPFNQFTIKADMIYKHADHSLAYSRNTIFAVGAFINNVCYGYCEKYDVLANTWTPMAPMRVPRSGVALCAFDNRYLFAFGGRN
jgi:hypothetical protein